MRYLKPIGLAAAGLALLAGCAQSGGPVTWNEIIKPNYDANSLAGAVTGPGIRVSVVGETYGNDRTALADDLAAILSQSHYGPRILFASRINDDDDYRDFEVRFLFSPQPSADFNSLCTDESFKQQAPEAGVTTFMASYCRKGRRINSVRGRVGGEIGSPAFQQLARKASLILFPPPGYSYDVRGNNFNNR